MFFYKIHLTVQIYTARIIVRFGKSEHVTPLLHDLNWFFLSVKHASSYTSMVWQIYNKL